MPKELKFLNISEEEKKAKIKVHNRAKEVRFRWAQKGLFDIFKIIENECILIRKPFKSTDISGFTTFLDNNYIIVLNSSYTLGHERFSAAHELGHYILHETELKKRKILFDDDKVEFEATQFAVEFLMPAQGVKEIFKKIVNVVPDNVEPRHVVRMHNYFEVSYAAMLKRLVSLGLCSKNLYNQLREVSTLENHEQLKKLEYQEGFDCRLIKSSNVNYISKEYEELIKDNYEKNKISYKKLKNLLEFIDKTPQEFGYRVHDDE